MKFVHSALSSGFARRRGGLGGPDGAAQGTRGLVPRGPPWHDGLDGPEPSGASADPGQLRRRWSPFDHLRTRSVCGWRAGRDRTGLGTHRPLRPWAGLPRGDEIDGCMPCATSCGSGRPGHVFRACVDTVRRCMEREVAEREPVSAAIGKHTLLIEPGLGSWLLLGAIVTTLERWKPTAPLDRSKIPAEPARDASTPVRPMRSRPGPSMHVAASAP